MNIAKKVTKSNQVEAKNPVKNHPQNLTFRPKTHSIPKTHLEKPLIFLKKEHQNLKKKNYNGK